MYSLMFNVDSSNCVCICSRLWKTDTVTNQRRGFSAVEDYQVDTDECELGEVAVKGNKTDAWSQCRGRLCYRHWTVATSSTSELIATTAIVHAKLNVPGWIAVLWGDLRYVAAAEIGLWQQHSLNTSRVTRCQRLPWPRWFDARSHFILSQCDALRLFVTSSSPSYFSTLIHEKGLRTVFIK